MQMIIKECLRDKYLTWHIVNVMKDIKHPGLRMIWLFYHWSQDRRLGIDGDIWQHTAGLDQRILWIYQVGLVVKLWMLLNDLKQTSLTVSVFQAKVLLAWLHGI